MFILYFIREETFSKVLMLDFIQHFGKLQKVDLLFRVPYYFRTKVEGVGCSEDYRGLSVLIESYFLYTKEQRKTSQLTKER